MLNIQLVTLLATSGLSSQSALMVSSPIMRFIASECLTFTNIIIMPTYRVFLASFSTRETKYQIGMASFIQYAPMYLLFCYVINLSLVVLCTHLTIFTFT